MMHQAENSTEVVIDRLYVLRERLGEGGMGTVYRAVHRLSGQDVALKLIYRNTVPEDERITTPDSRPVSGESVRTAEGLHLRLALEREFELLASLHHPHIVRVLDYGFAKACGPYLVMELLPAALSLVEAGCDAPAETKIEWMGQLLRALAYMHRRGMIHRDIKPSNVLCVAGQVKVVDFGIALRNADSASLAGTLEYMAPELMIGAEPSIASDLYSVGVLACQLFTGSFPDHLPLSRGRTNSATFGTSEGITVSTDAAAFLEALPGAPQDPGVADRDLHVLDGLGAPLKSVIARLLAPAPDSRYPDSLAALRDLGAATGLPLLEDTAETRESFLQAAALVGRDQELEILTSALRSTRNGKGAIWLIGGESGVGKSRLLDELRTIALVRGARVLRGQAVREGGGPFHVLREVLERICLEVSLDDQTLGILLPILPRIAGLLDRSVAALPTIDSQSMQERALVAILGIFDAASREKASPLVLLLEDLQWAGKESLGVLSRLASLVPQRALLVVGTYRDDESPELAAAIPNVEVLKLPRLDTISTAALCESMLGQSGRSAELLDFLNRESSGNPLFIIEIVRALADEAGDLSSVPRQRLPDHLLTGGIRAVLDRRISHVPLWAQPLLSLAAVAGVQLDLTLLAHADSAVALLGRSIDAWLMHCASMSILEFRDQRWRFTHHKLRECVLARLKASGQLVALHHEAARAIESAYPGADGDEHIGGLAYHCLEALPLVSIEKVCETALRAAARAMQQLSFDEAAELLERVQTVAEPSELSTPHRYELFLALGQVHIRAGNQVRGKQACQQAADLARQLGDAVLLARAAVTYGSEISPNATDPNLIPLLKEALGNLSLGDHPLRARALARLAAALQPAPDPEQPVALAREAVAMARRLGDAEVLRQTLIWACSALVTFGSLHERLELDRESVLLAEQAHDRIQAQRGQLRLAFDYAELGDMARLDASINAYEEGARRFRQWKYQWPASMLRAMRAQMNGRFSESDRIADEVRKLGETTQDSNAVFTATLHLLTRYHVGELYAELVGVESKLRPILARIFSQQIHIQQAITVWSLARAGLTAQVQELLAGLRTSRGLLQGRVFLPFVAEACYQVGDVVLAEQMYERLTPLSGSFCQVLYPAAMAFLPPYSYALGLLAMTRGRGTEAIAHLEDALARSESIGLRSHLARHRYTLAAALLKRGATGDRDRSRTLLWQARQLATELGQVGLFARIAEQEELAAAGGSGSPLGAPPR